MPSSVSLPLCCFPSIKFTMGQGKEGIIDFTPGSELLVAKAKNGHLSVVSVLYHLLHHYQFYVFVSNVFTDVFLSFASYLTFYNALVVYSFFSLH